MKYRVIWNTNTKTVVDVIPDQGGTITNYPDIDHEHAVIQSLLSVKLVLFEQDYDVIVIDNYIENNP